MRQLILTSLAAFMIIMPLFTASAASPQIGQTAPDFEATDIEGNPFKLSDHKGEIVVLEWTNAQCPFVMKHYDSNNMQNTQKQVTEKGIKWITINSSAQGRQGNVTNEEAAKILEDKNAAPTAKILDPSGEIGKMYDAKTTPHMFVIDAEGTLAYAGAIDSNASPNPATIEGAENYVIAAVDELLAGKAVTTSQTQPYGCSVKYDY